MLWYTINKMGQISLEVAEIIRHLYSPTNTFVVAGWFWPYLLKAHLIKKRCITLTMTLIEPKPFFSNTRIFDSYYFLKWPNYLWQYTDHSYPNCKKCLKILSPRLLADSWKCLHRTIKTERVSIQFGLNIRILNLNI